MQLAGTDARLRHMTRLLLAVVVALGLSAIPIATVQACSCAMPGSPAETVATADLAFVGTVVDTAPAPAAADGFGGMVRYAFEVERASAPTDATVEVRAVGGDGGASCGIEFGLGERWFVAAHRDAGSLQTNLCSGNLVADGMSAAELERLADVLSVVPAPIDASPVEGEETEPSLLLPAAIAALATLALAGVLVVSFRGRPARPS